MKLVCRRDSQTAHTFTDCIGVLLDTLLTEVWLLKSRLSHQFSRLIILKQTQLEPKSKSELHHILAKSHVMTSSQEKDQKL